eukprot:GHVU01143737.1.p1 GENE.GHVU01143737.1~~GHVU01143737.1.p1  ORF type:complete len:153 (+),score=0.91 GHVU01143737.1:1225-1683(+)
MSVTVSASWVRPVSAWVSMYACTSGVQQLCVRACVSEYVCVWVCVCVRMCVCVGSAGKRVGDGGRDGEACGLRKDGKQDGWVNELNNPAYWDKGGPSDRPDQLINSPASASHSITPPLTQAIELRPAALRTCPRRFGIPLPPLLPIAPLSSP